MNPALRAYLLILSAHLKDQMKSNDYKLRLQGLPTGLIDSKCLPIEQKLAKTITNLGSENLDFIKTHCAQNAIAKEMFLNFQDTLNMVIPTLVKFQVTTQGSIINYLNGAGGCQEHSLIAAYYLIKMMQTQDLGINGLEIVHLDVPNVGNHAFLIINRDLSRNLRDVSTWGANCFVFDPFMQWVANSQQLPTDSTLYEYANKTAIGCRVNMSNPFSSINTFGKIKIFDESHPLYFVQQHSNTKLREHMSAFLATVNVEDKFPIYLQLPFAAPIKEQLKSLLMQESTAKPIQCSTARELQRTTGIFFRTYTDSRYYTQVISEPLSEQAETTARVSFAANSRANFVQLGSTTRCIFTNVNAQILAPIPKAEQTHSRPSPIPSP